MLRKLVAVAVLGFLMVPALAVAEPHPQAGDWEITLSGSGSANDEVDAGNFGAAASVGYFLTNNFELALRQSASYSDFNAGTAWSGTTRLAADYHFDLGRWQPFLGANIGYVYGDNVSDTWAAAPEVGVKYFVHDKTFIMAMAEYQWFFDSGDELTDNFEDGQFVFTLGVGFLLP